MCTVPVHAAKTVPMEMSTRRLLAIIETQSETLELWQVENTDILIGNNGFEKQNDRLDATHVYCIGVRCGGLCRRSNQAMTFEYHKKCSSTTMCSALRAPNDWEKALFKLDSVKPNYLVRPMWRTTMVRPMESSCLFPALLSLCIVCLVGNAYYAMASI